MDEPPSGTAWEREKAEGCGAAEKPRAAGEVQKDCGGDGEEEEKEKERGKGCQCQSDAEDAALSARLRPLGRRRRGRGGRKAEVAALEERSRDGRK